MTLSSLKIAQRLGLGTLLALLAPIAAPGILDLQRLQDDSTILVGNHRSQAKVAGEALDNACGSIVRAVEHA
ncbi:hypothetical protein [Massilia rubra]|uniref:Uncharacterized protein n=1 Tax=Massilia rubra TaxID=2607910 RepID=A0ABX0LI01_9BURK|nr:hypothetical protein [Massilia rubra]NHZ32298.1 hypothetical protein [Massilia rubra]